MKPEQWKTMAQKSTMSTAAWERKRDSVKATRSQKEQHRPRRKHVPKCMTLDYPEFRIKTEGQTDTTTATQKRIKQALRDGGPGPSFGVGTELVRAADLASQLDVLVVESVNGDEARVVSRLTNRYEILKLTLAVKLAAKLWKQKQKHVKKLRREAPAAKAREALEKLGGDVSRGARVERLRDLQTIGMESNTLLEDTEGQSAVEKAAAVTAATFFIPGTRPWASSSAAPELRQAEALLTKARRPGTWKKLGPAWKRAREYIQSRMETDGLTYCTEDLVTRQWFITGAAVHAYNTRTAIKAVSDCLQACHMALRVSGIVPIVQIYDTVIAKVATTTRSSALRKVAAISMEELRKIVVGATVNGKWRLGWGDRSMPLVLRQCALQMELSTYKLLRFSCAAIINLFFVYWMGKSFAYKLLRRKNDQAGTLQWQVVAWTEKDCLAQRFRDFVIDTNPGLKIPEYGFAKSKKFVFRAVGPPANKTTGHNQAKKLAKMGMSDVITGDGVLPISCEVSRRSYKNLVKLMRRAMSYFNKYTPKQCLVFASQSLRRGGDTALWKKGASKEVRMAMGCWRTPDVELEYLETELEDQLAFDAKLWKQTKNEFLRAQKRG